MSQTEKVRSSWWVWAALLATLVLCYFAAQNSEEGDEDLLVATPNKRNSVAPNVSARASSSASSVSTSMPARRALRLNPTASTAEAMPQDASVADLPTLGFRVAFATPSAKDLFHPYVPPMKKVAKVYGDVVPPPPVAPKAPFQYVGKLEDDGKTTYFLMAQQRLVSAHLGEKLDGQWKLEGEEAQTLQLQYVPLALRQSLPKQALGKAIAPKDTSTQVTQ